MLLNLKLKVEDLLTGDPSKWHTFQIQGNSLLYLSILYNEKRAFLKLTRAHCYDSFDRHIPVTFDPDHTRYEILELLIAFGYKLRPWMLNRCFKDQSVFYVGIARLYIANGLRLDYCVKPRYIHNIPNSMLAFETGVVHCQKTIIRLLALKRRNMFSHIDRFLWRELAYKVWSTRCDDEWQVNQRP